MKFGGEQEFESATMPHVEALFQTALQLTEDRAAAEELVKEVCSYAWKSFGRCRDLTDCQSTLFKILIQRARCCPGNTTEDNELDSHLDLLYSASAWNADGRGILCAIARRRATRASIVRQAAPREPRALHLSVQLSQVKNQ